MDFGRAANPCIYLVKKKGTQYLNHLSWFYRVGVIHRFGKAVGEGVPVKGARSDVPGVRATGGMVIQWGWF